MAFFEKFRAGTEKVFTNDVPQGKAVINSNQQQKGCNVK
jgi:hypothetical protein